MRSTVTVSRLVAAIAAAAIAGCSTRPGAPPEVRIETAPVIVPVGCVRDRPAPVVPLIDRVPEAEWARRAPGAKAQAIRAQAGRRMNHDDALTAATAACPDAPRN